MLVFDLFHLRLTFTCQLVHTITFVFGIDSRDRVRERERGWKNFCKTAIKLTIKFITDHENIKMESDSQLFISCCISDLLLGCCYKGIGLFNWWNWISSPFVLCGLLQIYRNILVMYIIWFSGSFDAPCFMTFSFTSYNLFENIQGNT